ncbi:conserved Plasmodium protein, unknown function [Plasmodium berghei]|uniref:Uncharacterized protein n=2 Tax=Plasmodium berghei TaxID=5821 RepID=A0A509APC9_PLABA|nr:conserved Plasmodium protein, unknown function [Plasmodium berghei ANKA]CXJ01550.1 conserved Plasmodium protein, unknown function [Plasmodium berghei]SCL98198.1 conserved Plasmodium protein, unknown function [Plasmodium berghei]SCM16774.1 conserved Plasmodium protein, unknown function [Plasmodium berghei]SCM18572.1 conserved Plasmodium protein, unknown function [Plasmodium berghei]SCN28005.1 conserved Plasmodium protein, unknown function [Plasmodium berghei]|eukprot:XP_034423658.1 conserved Plasmodium protein, unknown function [Plasmodium berghei ANKA]
MKEHASKNNIYDSNKQNIEYENISKSMGTDENLSDVSVSTISNSTGIDSDLYNNVIKDIKREKRIKKYAETNDIEIRYSSESYRKHKKKYTSKDFGNEKKRTRRRKDKRSSYENERKYKKDRKKRKRTHSRSRSKDRHYENIPQDPFNPLLLAYEKNKTNIHNQKKNGGKENTNDRWEHDRYESTSSDEGYTLKHQTFDYSFPQGNITELRENIWKSKAGGVCLMQTEENMD